MNHTDDLAHPSSPIRAVGAKKHAHALEGTPLQIIDGRGTIGIDEHGSIERPEFGFDVVGVGEHGAGSRFGAAFPV